MARFPADPVFRALLARRVAIALLCVLIALCLSVVTYSVVVIRAAQVTNTARNKESAQTLERINECTTPGLKCFDDGQKRLAGTVDAVNNGSAAAAAAAAACADRPGITGYRAIKKCVDQTLLADRKR